MLQIKQKSPNSIEITDKKRTTILADHQVNLDSQVISSPGEYESGGVEIVYGESGALIIWERVQIVYQFAANPLANFDTNQFASADALIISPTLPEITKDQLAAWTETYDPTVIIAPSSVKLAAIAPTGAKVEESVSIKLTEQSLPTEGRDYYQLG